MNNVLDENKNQIKVDNTIFRYGGDHNYHASIIVDSENEMEAVNI